MNQYKYRLAISEAGLPKGYFFARGLPPPDNVIFREYSAKISQGDGGEARHGFFSVVIPWRNLTNTHLFTLRQLVESALTSTGLIYATVPRGTGKLAGYDWVNISGVPYIPEGTQVPRSNGRILTIVELTINNVTVL